MVERKHCPKCHKGWLYKTGTSWACDRCDYSRPFTAPKQKPNHHLDSGEAWAVGISTILHIERQEFSPHEFFTTVHTYPITLEAEDG